MVRQTVCQTVGSTYSLRMLVRVAGTERRITDGIARAVDGCGAAVCQSPGGDRGVRSGWHAENASGSRGGMRGDRASWITLLAGADFARSVVGLNSGGGGSQQFNSTVRRFGSGSRFGADAMETC